MCLSGIAVALRLILRRTSKAGLWYDDYAIIIALFFSYGLEIPVFIILRYRFGKYLDAESSLEAFEKWYQVTYAVEQIYNPAITMPKLSILFLYARIFPGAAFRRYLYGMGAVVTLSWVASQFTAIFQCTPIHFFWTRTPITGHCVNVQAYFIGQAVPNIVTDVLIMALPLPQIWKLKLPWQQKTALSGIFLLGCFVTFSSIYRLVQLTRLSVNSYTDYSPADAEVPSMIWTVIEPNMAVVCACLPMFRRLFEKALRLHTSANKNPNPVTEVGKGHFDRRHSFERLHETSEDLSKERASVRTTIPSTTTTTIGRAAALEDQHESGVALDVIRVTDEVRWSNIDP